MQQLKAKNNIWTRDTIFDGLKTILPKIAPLKAAGPLYPETSLADDLDFDSLDIVEMLAEINDYFAVQLDFEKWLIQETETETETDAGAFTIRSLFNLLWDTIQEGSHFSCGLAVLK